MIHERGLKQSWVADQIGVTQSHFSEMIRGLKRFPIEKAAPLAKVLHTDVAAVVAAATEPVTD